jgi:hypothetical protein
MLGSSFMDMVILLMMSYILYIYVHLRFIRSVCEPLEILRSLCSEDDILLDQQRDVVIVFWAYCFLPF